ncbi:hypothetical protein [Haloferula sargassicola]|uniref:Uncharacterized protein n=1 Tax=Haloferula sargassicola TaxID=490096 RepID=A0ABP9UL31_9BACT
MPKPSDHPLADMPATLRIDATLATLSAAKLTPPGGWSLADLADLCGCSEAAILTRQRHAITAAKRSAGALGIDPKTIRRLPLDP